MEEDDEEGFEDAGSEPPPLTADEHLVERTNEVRIQP